MVQEAQLADVCSGDGQHEDEMWQQEDKGGMLREEEGQGTS